MNSSKAVIRLVSTQSTANGENERIELISEGIYEKTPDGYVMSYKETEATGFVGSKTTLTIHGSDFVVMQRTGSANSHLILEKGQRHLCHYGTPYGNVVVGVTATDIRSELCESGGSLDFKYTIDVNSAHVGDYGINITVSIEG